MLADFQISFNVPLTKNKSQKKRSTVIILREQVSLYLTVKYSMLM